MHSKLELNYLSCWEKLLFEKKCRRNLLKVACLKKVWNVILSVVNKSKRKERDHIEK